ncbi:uncharacterized protein LOC143235330 [Tachypleus tridentatus]|uniref:uncharacterized protein LOC143235330 n=1 Tax=Tachypleus tridentatus TaxID=6853 RepID=UPI003FD1FB2C
MATNTNERVLRFFRRCWPVRTLNVNVISLVVLHAMIADVRNANRRGNRAAIKIPTFKTCSPPSYRDPGISPSNYRDPGISSPNYRDPGISSPNYRDPGISSPNYRNPENVVVTQHNVWGQ